MKVGFEDKLVQEVGLACGVGGSAVEAGYNTAAAY